MLWVVAAALFTTTAVAVVAPFRYAVLLAVTGSPAPVVFGVTVAAGEKPAVAAKLTLLVWTWPLAKFRVGKVTTPVLLL